MLDRHAPGERRLTLGADKAYDARGFTADLRRMCVTPHIACNDTVNRRGRQRPSSIDARTTRHPGYAVSQRARKRIEEAFSWAKTIAGCARAKLRGTRSCRLPLHLRNGRLQPHPHAPGWLAEAA